MIMARVCPPPQMRHQNLHLSDSLNHVYHKVISCMIGIYESIVSGGKEAVWAMVWAYWAFGKRFS